MTIAIEQTSTVGKVASASSASTSFGALPTAGAAIIVAVSAYVPFQTVDFDNALMSDNQGNPNYSIIAQGVETPGHGRCAIFRKDNIGSPSGTFTITISGFPVTAYLTIGAISVTGLGTAPTGDKIASGGGNVGTSASSGTTGMTTVADEIIVAAIMSEETANPSALTIEGGMGWTQIASQLDNVDYQNLSAYYRIVAAKAGYNASWTKADNVYYSACIATFEGPSSAPTALVAKAGVYAYYDWQNLDPATFPWIRGGMVPKQWKELETADNTYSWTDCDNRIAAMRARICENGANKGVLLKVTVNDRSSDGVPAWAWALGIPVVTVGAYDYPKWWDSTFKTKWKEFIAALGARYNGNADLDGVMVCIGEYGEAMPGYGSLTREGLISTWSAAGLTSQMWIDYCAEIMGAYLAAFPNKKLYLSEQYFGGTESASWEINAITAYAAGFGIHIGFNGLDDANAFESRWYDPFRAYVPDTVEGYLETGFTTYTPAGNTEYMARVYWSVLNALRNHASIMAYYTNDYPMEDPNNEGSFDFGNLYAGRTKATTPGVWCALGHLISTSTDFYNYDFWLSEINAANVGVYLTSVTSEKYGARAKRTSQAGGASYLRFVVDSGVANGNSTYTATIKVWYYDSGTSTFEVLYDAVSSANKSAGIVTKTNTGAWVQATFAITDGYFGKRQAGGADISLYANGSGDTTFHMIEIADLNSVPPEPVIEEEPSPVELGVRRLVPIRKLWPLRSGF